MIALYVVLYFVVGFIIAVAFDYFFDGDDPMPTIVSLLGWPIVLLALVMHLVDGLVRRISIWLHNRLDS